MKKIAELLLERELTDADRYSDSEINALEEKLGIIFPAGLAEFYRSLGKVWEFTESFQRFIKLEELRCCGDKVIFLEENQGVCYWAFAKDGGRETLTLYQTQDEVNWYEEDRTLPEFIRLLLYYQLAQGGYPFAALLPVEARDELSRVREELLIWEKVVDWSNLVIFQKQSRLIWYFTNIHGGIEESLFVSTLHEIDLQHFLDEYGFEEI